MKKDKKLTAQQQEEKQELMIECGELISKRQKLLLGKFATVMGFLELGAIVAINLAALEQFEDGAEVSVATLIEAGVVKNAKDGVKILGNGELTKKLTVKANAFSKSAAEKIEALGGKAEVI